VVEELIRKAVEENARAPLDQDEYNARYEALLARFKAAEARLGEIDAERSQRRRKQANITRFLQILAKQENLVAEFDEELGISPWIKCWFTRTGGYPSFSATARRWMCPQNRPKVAPKSHRVSSEILRLFWRFTEQFLQFDSMHAMRMVSWWMTRFSTCVTKATEWFVTLQESPCFYQFKIMSPILAIVWHPEKEAVVVDYRIQPMYRPWCLHPTSTVPPLSPSYSHPSPWG